MKCPICDKNELPCHHTYLDLIGEIKRLEKIRRDAIVLCDPWNTMPPSKLAELKLILGDFEE